MNYINIQNNFKLFIYNISNEEDSIISDDEFDYGGYNNFICDESELYNHKE